jgi:hypothetical protein
VKRRKKEKRINEKREKRRGILEGEEERESEIKRGEGVKTKKYSE